MADTAMQLVRVGEHICLFRPDNHALALVTPEVAAMCGPLLVTEREAEFNAAPSDAKAEWRAQLEAAGLLPPVDADKADRRGGSCEPRQAALPRQSADMSFSRVLCIGAGPLVRLDVQCDLLARLLEAVTRPLTAPAAADRSIGSACADYAMLDPARPDAVIDVGQCGGVYSVARDGIVIASGLQAGAARRIALQALLMALHPPGTVSAILHASTIAIGGRAIVLAGATGSGKTTLAACLAATGASYLADDFTPVCATPLSVACFPVALSLKQTSWPLLRGLIGYMDLQPEHQVGDRVVRYVDPRPSSCEATAPVPVGALVLPRYEPGTGVILNRLSAEQAFAGLMTTGSEIVGHPRSITALATLVNQRPAWRLVYSRLDQAADAIRSLA